MKRILFFTSLVTICSSACFTQDFSLTDSVFNKNDKLITRNVIFLFPSDSLFKESQNYLDTVAMFLIMNDSLHIEIGVHCDERGSDQSSRRVTQRRAQKIFEYLISKGVPENRLSYIGFQDTKPIIKGAKTDEEHYLNRRTEFKITEIN